VKTLTGTPDPQRPRNAATWTAGTSTTASAANARVDWITINRKA
jgi:hypothetical protein